MNIEEFREYCLSLKGVREKMPLKKDGNRRNGKMPKQVQTPLG